MTHNLHVCASCCRPNSDCDVISGQSVQTIEGYIAVDFVVARSNSFPDSNKKHFVTAAEADTDDSIVRKSR